MAAFVNKYKLHFLDRNFLFSFFIAILLLAISLIINFYAGIYATERASNSVSDLVLGNIRVFDVDGIFVYGSIIFWIFIWFLLLFEPQRFPFTLKSISLFILIRSVFISLTHMGPYPTQLVINSNLLSWFTFGGDLFFSGHTGLPFLLALIFWDNFYLRFLFIASAIFFGIIVLMAHLHYSIDVVSAFFITYAIYRLAEIIFKKDRKIFIGGLQD